MNLINLEYNVHLGNEIKERKNWSNLVGNYLKVFGAEFFGTLSVMFFGCGCLNSSVLPHWNEFLGSYMFGLVFGSATQIFFNVSNAHLNPVITLIFFLYGYISIIFVAVYILAQILGAVAGTVLYKYISEVNFKTLKIARNPHQCETVCNPEIGTGKAFVWELLASILLGLFVSSIIDFRSKDKRESYSIKIAILIGVLTTVLTPYTGGSMNPARSFAPSFLHNNWDHQWIYWLAPITGGLIGAITYHTFFLPPLGKTGPIEKEDDDAVPTLG